MSKDKLTDSKLRAAKPAEKEYNLGDGSGLSLRVRPDGVRLWLFNYYRPADKKRANISFGPYPDVSLATARQNAVKLAPCWPREWIPRFTSKNRLPSRRLSEKPMRTPLSIWLRNGWR